MPLVTVADRDGVRTVIMSHPERRNALSETLSAEVLDAVAAASCRVLILRAEPGVTTWSAGHDVDDLPGQDVDPITWISPVERLVQVIAAAPFPVIAAVEGGAWGAACNLALACDLLVATRTATFAITPARLGVPYHPDGIAQVLAAVPANTAREMLFTAQPLAADSPLLAGTVNRLAESSAELTAICEELAQRIACLAPFSIESMKAEINALLGAVEPSPDTRLRLAELRRQAWQSDDLQEGLAAFRERRAPRFEGR